MRIFYIHLDNLRKYLLIFNQNIIISSNWIICAKLLTYTGWNFLLKVCEVTKRLIPF